MHDIITHNKIQIEWQWQYKWQLYAGSSRHSSSHIKRNWCSDHNFIQREKDRTNFFRQHRKLQDITTHQFSELGNTFIFMNESLQAENRKLLNLTRSEYKKKTISITGLDLSFEVLMWKFVLSQPYNGWIKMKAYSPTNFPSSSQPIGQYISHSYWKQFIVWNYHFSGPTGICLNSVIYTVEESGKKFKVNNRSIILVSLLLT